MPDPTNSALERSSVFLGFGTSHDSGLCVVDSVGRPLFAASLERLSRVKSDWGPPLDLLAWAEKSLRRSLTELSPLPIQDDNLFPLEQGFYAVEQGGGVGFFLYRWTAPEAVIRFPAADVYPAVYIKVVTSRIWQRLLAADVYINGAPAGRMTNRKAIWRFQHPDGKPVSEVRLVATTAFKASDPDPRTLGMMIMAVYGIRQSGPSAPPIAGDTLPAVPALVRFAAKYPYLVARSRRAASLKTAAKELFLHANLMRGGFKSLADGILAPLPVTGHYDHHLCHAATAYYPSGFNRALVVTLDGMGNDYSCRVMRGINGRLEPLDEYYYEELPIGLNYEAITRILGFNPLRHAGKITGLAAYGTENGDCMTAVTSFLEEMWRLGGRKDYSYELIVRDQPDETLPKRIRQEVFGRFSREDVAYAIQKHTEEQVVQLISSYMQEHRDLENICLAGGVFANVRVNQIVHKLGFRNIFIQPAMSDVGLAFGAALLECISRNDGKLQPFHLEHVFLGPGWGHDEIAAALRENEVEGEFLTEELIATRVAELLLRKKVVAHYFGRMEFGPRALGNRSILYSAADPDVNRWLNEQLNRTEFMPFAPAVMWEHADDYFLGLEGARHAAEFMTITCDCTERAKREIPAAVHVDGTARPQLVHRERNPRFHAILSAYHQLTGTPVVINTSFNMHEEPIVASPSDALRAFRLGQLDVLVLGSYLITRKAAD